MLYYFLLAAKNFGCTAEQLNFEITGIIEWSKNFRELSKEDEKFLPTLINEVLKKLLRIADQLFNRNAVEKEKFLTFLAYTIALLEPINSDLPKVARALDRKLCKRSESYFLKGKGFVNITKSAHL